MRGTVRFISDFRELNKTIKNKPFPTPKILDLLLILEGFRSAISSDLTIRYYHITLYLVSQKLYTSIYLGANINNIKLPMGLCNSPNIFQEKMNELFNALQYIRAYIDDL